MPSIRTIQIERAVSDISRILHATGIRPTLSEVLNRVSIYFSKNPVGKPLKMKHDFIQDGQISNVELYNELIASLQINMDVLYSASSSQVEDVMDLSEALRVHVNRLKAKRSRLEAQVDDYLLSLYNTDGYYYSISDNFADLSFTDLSLTSAFVNTVERCVTLPTVSSFSKKVPAELIGSPTINVKINEENTDIQSLVEAADSNVNFQSLLSPDPKLFASWTPKAPWGNATDGLSNTVWTFEVETDAEKEVLVSLHIPLGNSDNPMEISRIEIDPYGITPSQYCIRTNNISIDSATIEKLMAQGSLTSSEVNPFMVKSAVSDYSIESKVFGNQIITPSVSERFSLTDEVRLVESIDILIRKTKADFIDRSGSQPKFRYIFGFKDMSLTYHVYDNEAVFVSRPLYIPSELENEVVIDAVSLVAQSTSSEQTYIDYYVAAENGSTTLGGFDWKKITPLNETEKEVNVVRFDGANIKKGFITDTPTGDDLKRIKPNTVDANNLNPNASIIPGVDVYRIAEFDQQALLNSLSLEEGVNATRIYHTALSDDAVASLDWWKEKITTLTPSYGNIDTGNGFFYGGDIGDHGISVYVETKVENVMDVKPFLDEFRKADQNSQTWTVRVFLNGRDIAYLPPGQNSQLIPWVFQSGSNHVSLLVNIPKASTIKPNPHLGIVELFKQNKLTDFGTVKLATWSYVDFFDMKYNQVEQPQTFTIFNNEIVSRRKPTANFRLNYALKAQHGITAVRLRADVSRSSNNQYVSPKLSSYRLRFSYGV